MALESKNQTLASEFVTIKARVKAEMLRRSHDGSLKKYAGEEYDYSVAPTPGGQLLPEHFNKIIEPLNAVKPTGFETVSSGDQAMSIKDIETALSEMEKFPMSGSSSGRTDCQGSCSGLCYSHCWNSCSGCGYSCSTDCSGDCSDACNLNCAGSCGACSGCDSNCWGGCSGSCWGYQTGGSGSGYWIK